MGQFRYRARMGERSLRQTLRRTIAPVAFLGALAVLGARTCGTEMAQVELRFDLGRAAPDVRALAVDVYRGDEVAPVAYHTADFGAGGAPAMRSWELQLDPGSYVLRIRVATSTGTHRIERRLQVSDRSSVTVDLEEALTAPP